MLIQLANVLEQLRVGLREALQRQGLAGFFCNHDDSSADPLAGVSTD